MAQVNPLRIFIGGSRNISTLTQAVKDRLDNIINNNFSIVVGDASGVDKTVQQYLAAREYENVTVYCTGESCRNNLGNWGTKRVKAAAGKRGFDFYALKDQQMAQDATYGFMLWDTQSNGTLNNILNLLGAGKKVLVFLAGENSFQTIRNSADLSLLLTKCEQSSLEKFETKLSLSQRLKSLQSEAAAA